MKIAILTQPLGLNYGGMMQAWALQQVLIRMGHEVVTIDYKSPTPSAFHAISKLIYRFGLKLIGKRRLPVRYESFLDEIQTLTREFIVENIVMSSEIRDKLRLASHFKVQCYDAVVVGSDQTWRPKYSPDIGSFFLDFLDEVNIVRLAYASSFGVDEWEYSDSQTKKFRELAARFDAISVREASGVDLCRVFLGVESIQVLDPTLLLNREDYLRLIGEDRLGVVSGGVFTYFLDKSLEKDFLAKEVARRLNEKMFSRQYNFDCKINGGSDGGYGVMPDPRDWLAGFAKCRCVITDSFHGAVFSIIFGKPFIAIGNADRGLSRFESLMKIGGIEERLISIDGNLDIDVIMRLLTSDVDDGGYQEMRSKSLGFLKSNLYKKLADK